MYVIVKQIRIEKKMQTNFRRHVFILLQQNSSKVILILSNIFFQNVMFSLNTDVLNALVFWSTSISSALSLWHRFQFMFEHIIQQKGLDNSQCIFKRLQTPRPKAMNIYFDCISKPFNNDLFLCFLICLRSCTLPTFQT